MTNCIKVKKYLESVIESMNDAVFISYTDGNFLIFNEAYAKYHRFKDKNEAYNTLNEFPENFKGYFSDGTLASMDMWPVSRALRGETGSNSELMVERTDIGEKWWGSYSFAPIKDENGEINGCVVISRDITELKMVEDELKKKVDLLDISYEAIFSWGHDEGIVSWNQGAERLYGYTYDEVMDKLAINCLKLNSILNLTNSRKYLLRTRCGPVE